MDIVVRCELSNKSVAWAVRASLVVYSLVLRVTFWIYTSDMKHSLYQITSRWRMVTTQSKCMLQKASAGKPVLWNSLLNLWCLYYIQAISELKCEMLISVEEIVGTQQKPHIYIRLISEQGQYRSESSGDSGWVFDTSHNWACGVGSCFIVEGGKSTMWWDPWVKLPGWSGFSQLLSGSEPPWTAFAQ